MTYSIPDIRKGVIHCSTSCVDTTISATAAIIIEETIDKIILVVDSILNESSF